MVRDRSSGSTTVLSDKANDLAVAGVFPLASFTVQIATKLHGCLREPLWLPYVGYIGKDREVGGAAVPAN